MALTFSVAKIKDYTKNFPAVVVDGCEQWNPITYIITMTMMVIGLGRIDEKNLDEFVRRFDMYQRVIGPLLHKGDGTDIFVTREHIEQHMGLTTNCYPELTNAAFDKRLMGILRREVTR